MPTGCEKVSRRVYPAIAYEIAETLRGKPATTFFSTAGHVLAGSNRKAGMGASEGPKTAQKEDTRLSLRKRPIVSEAMLAANRANALKSTGPRTDDGKSQSRLNGFKHGQRSRLYLRLLREIWVDHQLAIKHMDLLYELQKSAPPVAAGSKRSKARAVPPPAFMLQKVKHLLEEKRSRAL